MSTRKPLARICDTEFWECSLAFATDKRSADEMLKKLADARAASSHYEYKEHDMNSKPFPVLVAYACLALAATCLLALPCYGDDLVKKHIAFARSLLDSPDEVTRAEALEVVLASAPLDGPQLARKALESRVDKTHGNGEDSSVCLAALDYLSGRADKESLRTVRELLAKNAHPKNMRRGYLNITASLAAEVLLRSDDQDARKQAIGWVEERLGDPEELGMWEQAVGLVGAHRLSQLKAHLIGNRIRGDERGIVAAALAKLGDEPSQKFMRDKLTDPRGFFFIVNDLNLVKLLGLSCNQIESAVPSRAQLEKQFHDPEDKDWNIEASLGRDETAMARACAYLGHPEHLSRLARQMLDLSKAPRGSWKRDKLFSILLAIRDVGNESMIPGLEEFFANVRSPVDEFYCPMHLQIVRSTLEPNGEVSKCPICGMPLSNRKNREADNWLKLDASVAILKIASRRDGRNHVSK